MNNRKEEAIHRLKTKLKTSRKLNINGVNLRFDETDNLIGLLEDSMEEINDLKTRLQNLEKERKRIKRTDVDMGKF